MIDVQIDNKVIRGIEDTLGIREIYRRRWPLGYHKVARRLFATHIYIKKHYSRLE